MAWIVTFVASAAALKVNASAPMAASVFQSLILSVYCGAPATALLVITYLGNRPGASLHPDLPIGIGISKCKVFAFNTIDHALTYVPTIDHALDQFIE